MFGYALLPVSLHDWTIGKSYPEKLRGAVNKEIGRGGLKKEREQVG
jgi:hypothetical protein